jgi:hypothetical protein
VWKVVGKLKCGVCKEVVDINDKVLLDCLNTVIHQKCYYKSPQRKLPIKDEGPFQKMLMKYPFFY